MLRICSNVYRLFSPCDYSAAHRIGPVAPGVFGTPATGPFLANTGFEPFTGTNSLGQTTISGEYEAMVYSDPKNTFCAGCLDFFIIVDNNSSSTDSIERITLLPSATSAPMSAIPSARAATRPARHRSQ
jgi:hypothetical protein